MNHYRLQRMSDVDVEFDGELLAEETTWEADGPRSERWQELRIYRTSTNRWVVERLGRSVLEGDEDRPRANVCNTPEEVRKALTHTHVAKDGERRSYITDAGYTVLNAAAAKDPRLERVCAERV